MTAVSQSNNSRSILQEPPHVRKTSQIKHITIVHVNGGTASGKSFITDLLVKQHAPLTTFISREYFRPSFSGIKPAYANPKKGTILVVETDFWFDGQMRTLYDKFIGDQMWTEMTTKGFKLVERFMNQETKFIVFTGILNFKSHTISSVINADYKLFIKLEYFENAAYYYYKLAKKCKEYQSVKINHKVTDAQLKTYAAQLEETKSSMTLTELLTHRENMKESATREGYQFLSQMDIFNTLTNLFNKTS